MELKADAEERREQVFAVLEDTESTQKDIKEVYNVWVPYIEEVRSEVCTVGRTFEKSRSHKKQVCSLHFES